MSLLKDELKIVSIKEIFELNLFLPGYQRPYRWSVESANTLFSDIYTAYKKKTEEYRLGSVILQKSTLERTI